MLPFQRLSNAQKSCQKRSWNACLSSSVALPAMTISTSCTLSLPSSRDSSPHYLEHGGCLGISRLLHGVWSWPVARSPLGAPRVLQGARSECCIMLYCCAKQGMSGMQNAVECSAWRAARTVRTFRTGLREVSMPSAGSGTMSLASTEYLPPSPCQPPPLEALNPVDTALLPSIKLRLVVHLALATPSRTHEQSDEFRI